MSHPGPRVTFSKPMTPVSMSLTEWEGEWNLRGGPWEDAGQECQMLQPAHSYLNLNLIPAWGSCSVHITQTCVPQDLLLFHVPIANTLSGMASVFLTCLNCKTPNPWSGTYFKTPSSETPRSRSMQKQEISFLEHWGQPSINPSRRMTRR